MLLMLLGQGQERKSCRDLKAEQTFLYWKWLFDADQIVKNHDMNKHYDI